mmetsp:Transcript_69653/g.201960  ORF Transcript_69653/g.201960 Transcript_69653/m.201960 type:complete len:346 (+) Transcript_69653:185-1222(+)
MVQPVSYTNSTRRSSLEIPANAAAAFAEGRPTNGCGRDDGMYCPFEGPDVAVQAPPRAVGTTAPGLRRDSDAGGAPPVGDWGVARGRKANRDNSGPFVLWCNERACKPEHEGERSKMAEIAAKYNGSLLCMKKAKTFGSWAGRGGSKCDRYVLVTDRRELKPCLRILAQERCRAPLAVITICDYEKSSQRIESWLNDLPEDGLRPPFTLVSSVVEVDAIMRDIIDSELSEGDRGCATTACLKDSAALLNMPQLPAVACEGSNDAPAGGWTPRSLSCMSTAASSDCGSPSSHYGLRDPGLHFFAMLAAAGVSETVLRVLAPAMPGQPDATAVEWNLSVVAPEVYED